MRIIENADKGIIPDETYEEIELNGNYTYPAVLSEINRKYFVEFPDFDYEGACGRSELDAIFEAEKALARLVVGFYGMLPSPSDVDSIQTEDYESVILITADMDSLQEH